LRGERKRRVTSRGEGETGERSIRRRREEEQDEGEKACYK
jgi:hypothetical protein